MIKLTFEQSKELENFLKLLVSTAGGYKSWHPLPITQQGADKIAEILNLKFKIKHKIRINSKGGVYLVDKVYVAQTNDIVEFDKKQALILGQRAVEFYIIQFEINKLINQDYCFRNSSYENVIELYETFKKHECSLVNFGLKKEVCQ